MSSERTRRVFALAAELPDAERAELARDLIRTLPGDVDELELEDEELARRLDAIHAGTATVMSWAEARAILRDE